MREKREFFDPETLHKRAAQCRRLAASVDDPLFTRTLNDIADEYDQTAVAQKEVTRGATEEVSAQSDFPSGT